MDNKSLLFGLTISLAILMFGACSSGEQYEYSLTYKVYYNQDNVQTYFDTYVGDENKDYIIGSSKGSNYIFKQDKGAYKLIETSAPIEIVSHIKKPIGDSEKNQSSINDLGYYVNSDGNLIYTRVANERRLQLLTLEFNGEKHEYVFMLRSGSYTGGISLSHWAGCKYCKEHNHNEFIVEPQIEK